MAMRECALGDQIFRHGKSGSSTVDEDVVNGDFAAALLRGFNPHHGYASLDQRTEIAGTKGEEYTDHAIDAPLPRPIEKMPLALGLSHRC